MTDNNSESNSPESTELRGLCWLGYTNFTKVKSYSGSYPINEAVLSPTSNIPASAYASGQFKKSSKLRSVLQANNALIPKVNTGIGAPRCTFVYGGISPDKTPFFANYIKGPNANYGPFNWSGALTGVASPNANTTNDTTQYTNTGESPIIPVRSLPAKYGNEAPPILTTYNIWELENTKNLVSNHGVKFKENLGYVYDDLKDYSGPYLTQQFDNDTVYAKVDAPPGHPAHVMRRYPMSQDLMYEKEAKLYYPDGRTPDSIGLEQSGMNCGFHVSVRYNLIDDVYDDAANLVLIWGTCYAQKYTVSKFMLFMSAHGKPRLQYLNPITQNEWIVYPIEGPVLTTGELNIFVHFAGPLMLLGFDDDPQNWNVINAIREQDIYPSSIAGDDTMFYPELPPESPISMWFNNMHALFQYSPIAFDNYNLDQVWQNSADRIQDGDPTASVNTKSLYRLSHLTDNNDKGITIANTDFQKHMFLNKNYTNIETDETSKLGPTFYADWRSLNNQSSTAQSGNSKANSQLEIVNATVVGNKTSKEVPFVRWNTTVEGPILLQVSDSLSDDKPEQAKDMYFLANLTNYMTAWTATYTPELENRSFLKGEATVRLHNLGLTEEGRNILAALEEHVLTITLGGGYIDDPRVFFQGYVEDIQTVYEKGGATTTLRCVDIGYKVLSETKAIHPYTFACCRFKDIIQLCVEEAGLFNHYSLIESPYSSSDDLNKTWDTILKRRVARGFYYTSSSLTQQLSVNVADEPFYESVFTPVLTSVLDKGIFPIMYWNPEKEQLVFTTKQSECDELIFLGTTENGEDIPLPDNRHGVIIDKYTITTKNNNLVHGALFRSKSDIGTVLSYSPKIEKFIQPPILGEEPTNSFGWVGFYKLHYEDIAEQWKVTMEEVKNYGDAYVENYLKSTYNNLDCDVYVTEPLSPWAQFAVKTFNSVAVTDKYFYKSIHYTFEKDTNLITANIVGENIPKLI